MNPSEIDDRCKVKGLSGVYAIGDSSVDETKPLPSLAQIVNQQATYLANFFNQNPQWVDKQNQQWKFPKLVYYHSGMMSNIGGIGAVMVLRNLGGDVPAPLGVTQDPK